MIDQEGRLTFPLYHGTSTLFRSSIEKHGLGSMRDRNIFDVSILEQLAELLDQQQESTAWWQMHDFAVREMISEGTPNGGMNFRYEGVYFSPSRQTATMYAKSPKGSELVSYIFSAYEALKTINPGAASSVLPVDHPLTALFKESAKPLLITANRVKVDALETENGTPVHQQLEEMGASRGSRGAGSPPIRWEQSNFILSGTILVDDLVFENL